MSSFFFALMQNDAAIQVQQLVKRYGALTAVDELEIWWPSGLRERFEHLPVNTRVRITEGEGRFVAEPPTAGD